MALPILLDCDPGHDDAIAIVLALASPELDVKAITSSAGNQTPEKTLRNVLRMLTLLPLEQIDEMDKWEGSQLNTAKEILAFELTKLVHGEEEATKAQESARALFSGGNAANMPTATITEENLRDGEIDIMGLLVASGLCASRSEARRAVQQGGVAVNGEKVASIEASYKPEDINKEDFVLRRGKKNYRKIIFE